MQLRQWMDDKRPPPTALRVKVTSLFERTLHWQRRCSQQASSSPVHDSLANSCERAVRSDQKSYCAPSCSRRASAMTQLPFPSVGLAVRTPFSFVKATSLKQPKLLKLNTLN